MANKVVVNIENITEIQKEMNEYLSDFIGMMKELHMKIDESKEVFDTPFSNYLREVSNEMITKSESYIEHEIKPYINFLDIPRNKYQESINNISKTINNGRGGEII